uniref:Uncharacterized protein n=1 Tax=Pseudo-nitzschia australis TaxID=44445 RepID=A0A6U9XS66_9STRA|mmetsp:Transcript_13390/g.28075  ORF Transcript_13390/g.28075 Transcript_13390/m.28075 type:complete len:276 (+) Transcript_13390:140-967(+)|eukprot:CAMPEP_0168273642 /NCGR_PEP_ID=MMETSP0141_2-20121125/16849_1 /TAXON_ID=44445 /ORGANISM="Pseudo-nitzschia australis, Strain 10249 10 AB" /LENGTH=275 /DNA_ID=CAMNT_0008215127 /DNA_START=103 /DNA_END=930 /DNA_ORIENTATION=+
MIAISSTRSILGFVLVLSAVVCLSQAFFLPSATYCSNRQRYYDQGLSNLNLPLRESDSVVLAAKKKRRRRRKDSSPASSPSKEPEDNFESSSSVELPGTGELPDFDLDAESAPIEKKKKINPDEITVNMMGSGNKASRTLDELISDRALESKFEFDEKGDPGIPDFVDLAQASSTTPTYSADDPLSTAGVGTKKQRRAERVANAIAAKEAEEEQKPFLAQFPQFLNEKGDVSAIKVLEQGAWVGIFILIGWEVFINSPFFDRAGPMAPIVYEILM